MVLAIERAPSTGNTHSALSREGKRARGSRWRSKAAASAARCAIRPRPTRPAQRCAIAGTAKNSPAAPLPRTRSFTNTCVAPGRGCRQCVASRWARDQTEARYGPCNARAPDRTRRCGSNVLTAKRTMSSRLEEFHLRALPEPCMTLSSHTAPDVRPLP